MEAHERRFESRVRTDFNTAMATPFGNRYFRVMNLSFGGMQVEKGAALVGRGDEVGIKFRLPSGAGPITCQAQVVYDDGENLGIRFDGLSVAQQKILDRYLTRRLGAEWFE